MLVYGTDIMNTAVGSHRAVTTGYWLAQGLALTAVAVLVWRVALVAKYRAEPSVARLKLPRLTVIVPAYNEGSQVYDTLRSLAESDYPSKQLQIIAVDDGSQDDTWTWIDRAREELGSRVLAVRCGVNRGKRHALYEGFMRARGEFIVTVDSDSEVLVDTLRNLVSPMVRDRNVGAVAGNVRVLNRSAGLIPKMLDVSFMFSFEFIRASQSQFRAVFCSPGALSAYRTELIEQLREEWLAQRFLGRPATIGEDRALTNLVLREGYAVKFQSNAVVLTEVPTGFQQLCKMLLRWARSNVRETLAMSRFIFRRFRTGSAKGARTEFVWTTTTLLLAAAAFLPSIGLLIAEPSLLLAVAAGACTAAVVPMAVYTVVRGSSRALWAFPYALLAATGLAWIGPYALVTAWRGGWLTRPAVRPTPLTVPASAAIQGDSRC